MDASMEWPAGWAACENVASFSWPDGHLMRHDRLKQQPDAGRRGKEGGAGDANRAGERHRYQLRGAGQGEPVVLIPYLAADQACYAFQIAEYVKHFTCFTVDLRGACLSSKPEGTYTTELFADDIAAFMQAAGIDRAHVSGLSLGAATGMWLAANYPERVKSLSLHSAWPSTDPFLRVVVEQWRIMAPALDSVTEMVIKACSPGASPRSCMRHDPST